MKRLLASSRRQEGYKKRRSMKKSTIIIIVVIALLAIWGVTGYNGLVTMDENVSGQWSNVETQYQRRADLIPNLVMLLTKRKRWKVWWKPAAKPLK